MFGVNIHGLTFMSISIEVLKIRQLFFIYAYDLYIKTYCREINIHVRKKKYSEHGREKEFFNFDRDLLGDGDAGQRIYSSFGP